MKTVYLTIDLDMVNYSGSEWDFFDEMEFAFAPVFDMLKRLEIPATWFVRIDRQIADVYGDSRYMCVHHRKKLERLLTSGHQLGWHYHAYRQRDGKWVQNLDETQICLELSSYGEIALREGFHTSRMGWGYHTQATMTRIDEMGFLADSSAIPRPIYPWSITYCNWERTGQKPYHPSRSDFQTESPVSSENLRLLEVPMTTAVVCAPYDEQQIVRYINPAYRHEIFLQTMQTLAGRDAVVLILHPYECVANSGQTHALLSFDTAQTEKNLQSLLDIGARFATLDRIDEDTAHEDT